MAEPERNETDGRVANDPIEQRLDRIYAAPLEDFTAERDALARELRERGDHEQAQEVKRLRKPSVPAWAINQASRQKAKQTGQLIQAGEALGQAQQSLSGRGGRERLGAARRRERELVRELAEEAERALRDAGRPTSAAARQQIDETLHAAALDARIGELVSSGRLVRPGVAVGFPGAGPSPARGVSTRGAGEKRKQAAIEKRLQREQNRLAEAAARREAAESELREAERAAKAAAKELDRAARRAQAESKNESELAERVERLRGELETAS
jgi:hypothetical protein